MVAHGFPRAALVAALAFVASPMLHAQACDIGAVQQLMSQTPRPTGRIDEMLGTCDRVAPGDWRTPWLRGVVARDAGRLDDAVASLERAREMAPSEFAPALDLGVTHEWRGDPGAARAVYDSVLARDPQSRPALLGKARVARSQGRLEEARGLYNQVALAEPGNLDAANGLAWLELDNLRVDAARQRFESVIAADPRNAEAAQGLERLGEAWRYRLDAGVGTANLAAGTSRTGYLGLLVNLNATDQLEVALGRNTRELPAARLADPTPLPSWTARVGYRSRFENGPGWSVGYEYRERSATSPEHRVDLGLDGRFPGAASRLQWFAGVRQSFSTPSDNRLLRAGLAFDFAPHWRVAGTVFAGRDKVSGSSSAVVLDLYREVGAMGSFFNVGVGHSPDPDNTSVHARLVYPVAQRQALVFGMEHRSLGNELEATVGWRVYWR